MSGILARQVLDSRGNPTVEADVLLRGGQSGRGTVPSGASTGVHEALELRDDDPKAYGGKGVLTAVSNITDVIEPRLLGMECTKQGSLDHLMIKLDGTPNKSILGANAILAVSMAAAKAGANYQKLPLFEYLSKRKKYRLPIPMMNVINGGKHAGNNLSIQEFLIEPVGAKNFPDGLRMGTEVYHALKGILKEKYGPSAINVGDEGGYAPPLGTTASALDAILEAIRKAGYDESHIKLGLDAASSSFYDEKTMTYEIDGRSRTSGELEDYYEGLAQTYPILTLEDPFSEDDFEDSRIITERLGARIKIIGDDLYVTNPTRIKRGIEMKATNAILIKLNQIGSVSETLEAIEMSKRAALVVIISHRSGETEDSFISHLATAVESEFIKTGAPARGERTAKYNELLRIYEILGSRALYAGF
ncbi:MAG: phosphopyruvate hydratase [Nitrososphaerales archaeon]